MTSSSNYKFFSYQNPQDQDGYCCEFEFLIADEDMKYQSADEIVKNLVLRAYKFLTTTPPRLFLWPDQEFSLFYENRCLKGLDLNDCRNGLLSYTRYLYQLIETKAPFIRIEHDLVCENIRGNCDLLRSYTEAIRWDVLKCLTYHKQSLSEDRIKIMVISSFEKNALDKVANREERAYEQREKERELEWQKKRECRCSIL